MECWNLFPQCSLTVAHFQWSKEKSFDVETLILKSPNCVPVRSNVPHSLLSKFLWVNLRLPFVAKYLVCDDFYSLTFLWLADPALIRQLPQLRLSFAQTWFWYSVSDMTEDNNVTSLKSQINNRLPCPCLFNKDKDVKIASHMSWHNALSFISSSSMVELYTSGRTFSKEEDLLSQQQVPYGDWVWQSQ